MMNTPTPRKSLGFTLVELLIVITIISLLMSMVFPAITAVMERMSETQCTSNQRGIVQALTTYARGNRLPPGVITGEKLYRQNRPDYNRSRKVAGFKQPDAPIAMGPNWLVHILPNLEQGPLFDKVKKCAPYANHVPSQCSASEKFDQPGTSTPEVFICPSTIEIVEDDYMTAYGYRNLAKGNYAANFGTEHFVNDDRDELKRRKKLGAFEVHHSKAPKYKKRFADAEFPGLQKVMPDSNQNYCGNWKMSPSRPVGVKLSSGSFLDGLDKTIMISEIVPITSSSDGRGAWFFPGMGGASFTAKNVPNAFDQDDVTQYDKVLVCDESLDISPLKCVKANSQSNVIEHTWASARSMHPESIVVGFAGGSARSFDNTIDLRVWKALCSRQGNDDEELQDLE